MGLSIRHIFFNLKIAIILLVIGISVLGLQLFTISHYSNHLTALKNQHSLLKKIMTTNLNDLSMATIIINGDISKLALYTQLSTKSTIFDTFSSSKEGDSLNKTLIAASATFQESVLDRIHAYLSGSHVSTHGLLP